VDDEAKIYTPYIYHIYIYIYIYSFIIYLVFYIKNIVPLVCVRRAAELLISSRQHRSRATHNSRQRQIRDKVGLSPDKIKYVKIVKLNYHTIL
jgi:hypothetical protein